MPEQITLSGDDFAEDDTCIVHRAGKQLQITLKQSIVERLNLVERDIIKIYVMKAGHSNKEKKHKGNIPKKEDVPGMADRPE